MPSLDPALESAMHRRAAALAKVERDRIFDALMDDVEKARREGVKPLALLARVSVFVPFGGSN